VPTEELEIELGVVLAGGHGVAVSGKEGKINLADLAVMLI